MIFEITQDMAEKDTPLEEIPASFIDFVKDMREKGSDNIKISHMTGVLRMNIDKI